MYQLNWHRVYNVSCTSPMENERIKNKKRNFAQNPENLIENIKGWNGEICLIVFALKLDVNDGVLFCR